MFLVRVETGRPLGAWFAHQRTVGIPKISAYRVAGDVHGFGDLANRLFPLQLVDGLGLSTLQQAYTPPTLGRNRMRFCCARVPSVFPFVGQFVAPITRKQLLVAGEGCKLSKFSHDVMIRVLGIGKGL